MTLHGQTDAEIHAEMTDTREWLRAKLAELRKARTAGEPKRKPNCPACLAGAPYRHSPDCEGK